MIKKLELGSEQKYKDSSKDIENYLSVFCWREGNCSLRTFNHLGKEDYLVLTNAGRKSLIKQLQLVDKNNGKTN